MGAAATLSAPTKRSAIEKRRVEESITGDERMKEQEKDRFRKQEKTKRNEEKAKKNEEKAKRNERPAIGLTIHLGHPYIAHEDGDSGYSTGISPSTMNGRAMSHLGGGQLAILVTAGCVVFLYGTRLEG